MDSFQIGTLAVYLIAVVTIGLWTKRRESTGDFLIANRSAGVVLTTASISALAGGSVLAVDTELGFVYGLGTLWLPAGGAAALALLGFLAGRIRRLADEHGFLTLTDYLFLRFGAPTGYLGFVLQFAGFLFLLAVQFIVGGRLFAALAPIEYPVAVVVMGVVTMAYLLLGGFKAVMRTDLLQFALMFLVFVVLVPVKANFTELDLELNFGSPGPVRSLSFFLSALGGLFVGADVWQRVYSARSGRVARTSLFLSAAVWLVFGGCLVLLGIAARGSPGATAEGALFAGLFELLPDEFASVATVAILAALMSTLDTEIFLLASMVAKDVVARRRELMPDQMARIIRLSIVGVAVPAMLIAIYWPSAQGVLFILLSMFVALFPTILVSLFRPLAAGVAFASILFGALLVTPAFLFGWSDQDTAPLVVLLGSGAVVILGLFRAATTDAGDGEQA